MRRRFLFTSILFSVLLVSIAVLGYFMVLWIRSTKLEAGTWALQIVIFTFTAAGGSVALIRYWDAVETNIQRERWEKLHYLETAFEEFRSKNAEVIRAFEWPHILESDYLPLCEFPERYRKCKPEERNRLASHADMARLRDLDNFLEHFVNLYFAIDRKLLSYDDVNLYMRYYIKILHDVIEDPSDDRLVSYIQRYDFSIIELIKLWSENESLVQSK